MNLKFTKIVTLLIIIAMFLHLGTYAQQKFKSRSHLQLTDSELTSNKSINQNNTAARLQSQSDIVALYNVNNIVSVVAVADTYLFEDFNSGVIDTTWQNIDEDGIATHPSFPVAQDWFTWQYNIGLADSSMVAVSSSWLTGFQPGNRNWLIPPKLWIDTVAAILRWKSAPGQGHLYMDGYTVLVSTTDSLLTSFTDTLVHFAQNINDDWVQFSSGMMHTNFLGDQTDQSNPGGVPGILTTWQASLGAYAGQNIFIAFLHDSDDDFVMQVDDIFVGVPASVISLNATITVAADASCFGVCDGWAIVNTTGGMLPYTYLWEDLQTTSWAVGLCADTHTVWIWDAVGDSISASVTINEPAALTISVTPSPAAVCGTGDSVMLIAAGADTYTWSPADSLSATTGDTVYAFPTVDTTYLIVGTDIMGCIDSITVNVQIITGGAVPVFTANTTTIVEGSTVTFNGSASTNATGYSWLFPGGTPDTSNLQNPVIMYNTAGTYDVTLTVTNACGGADSTLTMPNYITVNPPVGINENFVGSNSIKLYPNPTAGVIHIEAAADMKVSAIRVYDITGSLVIEYNNLPQFIRGEGGLKGRDHFRIDLSNQPKGTYMISIQTAREIVTTKVNLNK